MISRDHQLAVTRQAKLLGLSRASVYYTPEPVDDTDLALMRRLDELHLELPFAGSRMLRDLLRAEGVAIGREHVRTLMRRMGITAIYQQPKTTQRHRAHPVFPYLLRALRVTQPNHVWAADITYIRAGLTRYFQFFNQRRPHRGLRSRIPDTVYFTALPERPTQHPAPFHLSRLHNLSQFTRPPL